MNPAYPLYVVSKGRWKSQTTSKRLSTMGIPHYVVVEQSQLEDYRAAGPKLATFVVLDPEYQRAYETLDDLGLTKSLGPGPARNFAWEHSASLGFPWHWVMDDNIMKFHRLDWNLRIPVVDGTIFRVMETFCERYDNMGMAGPNYTMFALRKVRYPPYKLNTRIYSCNLIRNDLPYRWRGRYNEDTILSLDLLKAKWCTALFQAFLQGKMITQSQKGGNTEDFYSKEGTMPKSQMLADVHPDVATVVWKFRRWHHHVDYGSFTHQLRRRDGVVLRRGIDNFGMVLEQLDQTTGEWVRIDRARDDGPLLSGMGRMMNHPDGKGYFAGGVSQRKHGTAGPSDRQSLTLDTSDRLLLDHHAKARNPYPAHNAVEARERYGPAGLAAWRRAQSKSKEDQR